MSKCPMAYIEHGEGTEADHGAIVLGGFDSYDPNSKIEDFRIILIDKFIYMVQTLQDYNEIWTNYSFHASKQEAQKALKALKKESQSYQVDIL